MKKPAIPTPGPYARGTEAKSYRAAVLYLAGKAAGDDITIQVVAERHGISTSSVHQGIERIRAREAEARAREIAAWPEDECTC